MTTHLDTTGDLPRPVLDARERIRRVLGECDLYGVVGSPAKMEEFATTLNVSRIIKRPLNQSDTGVLDGMLIPLDTSYVIALNENVSKARQYYSLAHEIGHLILMKDEAHSSHPSRHGRRFRRSFTHEDPKEERLCEAIAAELLMPSELFARRLSSRGCTLGNVPSLAQEFGTSITSTAIRYTEVLPRPCLLVRWHMDRGPSTRLKLSWRLRNHARGPFAELRTSRNLRAVAFDGAQNAWSRPGLKSTRETLMLRSRGTEHVTFNEFRTESMAFGGGQRRFVLSVAYLADQMASNCS